MAQVRLTRDSDPERSLVHKAMSGDRQGFDELVHRHRSRVYAYCLGLVEHEQDAEDLTADTFLRAWLKRHTYRAEKATTFDAWLLAVARNLCRRFISTRERKRSNEREWEVESAATGDGHCNEHRQAWSFLKESAVKEIEALPGAWGRAFSLLLEGNTYQEIARQMSVSINYAGVLIKRARDRLQMRLAAPVTLAASAGDNGSSRQRQSSVWLELEDRLQGLIADYRLITVPFGERGRIQKWVPVLQVARVEKFRRRVADLQEQLRLAPHDRAAWRELAGMHRAAGALQEAADCYRKALQRWGTRMSAPERFVTYTHLADCFWTLERHNDARRAFRRALRYAPNAALRHAVHGFLRHLRADWPVAIRRYQSALSWIDELPASDFCDSSGTVFSQVL